MNNIRNRIYRYWRQIFETQNLLNGKTFWKGFLKLKPEMNPSLMIFFEMWTRLEFLLGLKLSGRTHSGKEASILTEELYERSETQN